MEGFLWETAEEINQKVATRLKQIRKRRQLTQEQLSQKSGVSYGSIKRFETTGNISLLSLTRLAIALDCVNDIKQLFTEIPYSNIEEVIRDNQ